MGYRLLSFLTALAVFLSGVVWFATTDFVSRAEFKQMREIATRGAAGERISPAEITLVRRVKRTTSVVNTARQQVASMYIAESPASYRPVQPWRENLMCYQAHILPGPIPTNVIARWQRRPKQIARAGVSVVEFMPSGQLVAVNTSPH